MTRTEAQRRPEEVEKKVSECLARHRPEFGDLGAEVVPGTARPRDTWWYVSVSTDKEPPRRFEYYDVLLTVEDELREKEGLDVQLVPSGPRANGKRKSR